MAHDDAGAGGARKVRPKSGRRVNPTVVVGVVGAIIVAIWLVASNF